MTSPAFSNCAGSWITIAVDVREATQRETFVLDAIGAAHDGNVRVPVEQFRMDLRRVLCLGSDHHDVVVGRAELTDRGDRVDLDDLAAMGRPQRETVSRDRVRVRLSGHQGNLGSALAQPSSDHTSDSPGPIDDHTHSGMVRGSVEARESDRTCIVRSRSGYNRFVRRGRVNVVN